MKVFEIVSLKGGRLQSRVVTVPSFRYAATIAQSWRTEGEVVAVLRLDRLKPTMNRN